MIPSAEWATLATSSLPTLAGFSVASYAVFFAVLSADEREALKAPEPTLGGRSPLLMLVSSVSHAVLMQISALLLAIVYLSCPLTLSDIDVLYSYVFALPISGFGLFLTVYAVVLILAPMISIFRIMSIQAKS